MTPSERREILKDSEVHAALNRLAELWTDHSTGGDGSPRFLLDVDELVRDELENLLVGLEIGRERDTAVGL